MALSIEKLLSQLVQPLIKQSPLLLICLISYLPGNLYAADLNDSYGAIGGFNEAGGTHSGIEAAFSFEQSDHASLGTSIGYYTSLNESHIIDTFRGGSFTALLSPFSDVIKPKLGLGIFIGDTPECSEEEELLAELADPDDCERKTVTAAYPEIGVLFGVGKLRLYPFARRYFDSTSGSSPINAYGIHLGWALGD